ncbi:MAG: hypothetical protein JXR71_03650 [Bacteroidales bacterium]|nr:hypothetical protein [Bacteroidales bacterium]
MEYFIEFVLSNFSLSFFVIGLIFSLVSLFRKRPPWDKKTLVEALFSYFLLFSIGISFFYNFVMHVFFADMAAKFIGWANSPFQYEVGFASLGFAVLGLIAFRGSLGFRAAAVLGPVFFLWGAAGGHVYQMMSEHNFAPGNAGVVFWSDIFLPVVSLILLYLQYQYRKHA